MSKGRGRSNAGKHLFSKGKQHLARERHKHTPQPRTSPDATPHLVEITKPLYGGRFLARIEGKAVFVPLALPGEQVRIRVTRQTKSYCEAEILETVRPSPGRVGALCPHFGVCGGCDYQHASYQTQLAMKEAILRETLERGGAASPAEIDVIAAEPWAYRNRIRIAFDERGNAGYRSRRSHAIVSIEHCPIAAPLLVAAALAIADIWRGAPAAPCLSEAVLFCNRDETEMLAALFVSTADRNGSGGLEPMLHRLAERVTALRGVRVETQATDRAPAQTLARRGDDCIFYRAAGFDYRVDQGAFFQVNRWLLDALVERAIGNRRGGVAWDLFAGVGLFARHLTKRFENVTAVEAAPAAIQSLRANLAGTTGTAASATAHDFLRSAVDRAAPRAGAPRPELVIVDPPRAGLGPETSALLAKAAPQAIVYVSCDPATLARDLQTLIKSGYRIASMALADLFPQTYHLESIVELHRS